MLLIAGNKILGKKAGCDFRAANRMDLLDFSVDPVHVVIAQSVPALTYAFGHALLDRTISRIFHETIPLSHNISFRCQGLVRSESYTVGPYVFTFDDANSFHAAKTAHTLIGCVEDQWNEWEPHTIYPAHFPRPAV